MDMRSDLPNYNLKISKLAIKQLKKIKSPILLKNINSFLNLIVENPYAVPPKLEKLVGLKDVYSRRINIQHRLIYKIDKVNKTIYVLSLWSHYEECHG